MTGKAISSLRTSSAVSFLAAGLLSAAFVSPLAWLPPRAAATPAKNNGTRKEQTAALSKAFTGKLPITELTEGEAVVHALNRLGYGPRPGEVARVRKMGLEKWIQQQLHPEMIDDAALEARLARYPTLTMTADKLLDEYPRPGVAAKRMGISVEAYRKRLDEMAKQRAAGGARAPADRTPQAVINELTMAKLARAIYSERQLNEQLADFWFNHFNVFVYKDVDVYLVPGYERDTIRPRVLGRFKDLLSATAHSPAMLFYLDNHLSADPDALDRLKHLTAQERRKQAGLPPVGGKRGLNENYGRELLELHTVGVDGGYTQKDVIAAARCLTGWTVRELRMNPEFYFDARLHDPGKQIVMGKKFQSGGIQDGEKLLEMLAKHKSTAKFISAKLARRFVSDNPPPAVVERMAKTFLKTNGDIRAVMQTMIYAPEFWSRQAYRAKVKTPLELVASTARALGADVDTPAPLVNWTARIGEPLYQCLPPTGYSDKAEAWVNTGGLLNRLNFAIALASNQIRGTHVELTALVGQEVTTDPKMALERAIDEFLGGQMSPQTRETLEKRSTDPQVLRAKLDDPVQQVDLGILTGLVLGSPEFQRR